jgi:hypothetical protein
MEMRGYTGVCTYKTVSADLEIERNMPKIPRKNPTKSTIKFAGLLRLKRVDYSVNCLVLAASSSIFPHFCLPFFKFFIPLS